MSASLFSKKALIGLGYNAWAVVALLFGQTLGSMLIVPGAGVVGIAISMVAGYVLALAVVLFALAITSKHPKLDRAVLGIREWPLWSDIGLGLLALTPYYLLGAVLLWLGVASGLIDPTVGQELVFGHLVSNVDLIAVFVVFVIAAPFAEELLFRGYLLGKLSKLWHQWLAVGVVALVFGLLHLPGFKDSGEVVWQWGAMADTFTLGLVAGGLRIMTGSIWAGVLLHAFKNAIAYYFLFINPLLTGSM